MEIPHRLAVRLAAISLLLASVAHAAAQDIDVYKRATCGCCAKWVEHLRSNGFMPQVHELEDIDPVKRRLGVAPELSSCHTAQIGGYVIEGHVPADLIRKLLKEHPDARGLAVPSMPAGAPGMEGASKMAYDVLLIKRDGSYSVYARR
nr:DUF411 domain-containing protein [uncultured Duganella sp.]